MDVVYPVIVCELVYVDYVIPQSIKVWFNTIAIYLAPESVVSSKSNPKISQRRMFSTPPPPLSEMV